MNSRSMITTASFVCVPMLCGAKTTPFFWHNEQPRYASLDFFAHAADWYDPETFVYYNGNYGRLSNISREYYYEKHPQYVLPILSYTDDEQSAITEIQIAYPEVITDWTMRFITGEKDAEKDWQEYLDALNGVGLQDYLKTAQAAMSAR